MGIDPQPSDVGRPVLYRPTGDFDHERTEEGVITSVNQRYVFVRFGPRGRATSAAVHRNNLEWAPDPPEAA